MRDLRLEQIDPDSLLALVTNNATRQKQR